MSDIDPAVFAQALAEVRAIPSTRPTTPAPKPKATVPAPALRRKPRSRVAAGSRRAARCGTYSGYVHHKVRGEDACDGCLEAKREYYRKYYAANRARIQAQRRNGGAA
jgi:hypothetical protein